MPKRTNEFQRLVTRIYQQMAGEGESVHESVMLRERESSTEREIDILLERNMFGTNIRIAVECRGRKHRDDIQWIDALIGKYRDLQVDKVITVSKTGFSEGARDKAAQNRIDVLTLEEALDTNWPNQFARLGMARLVRADRPESIQLETDPPVPWPLRLDTRLVDESGKALATVEEAAKTVYEKRQGEITARISERFLEYFKTLADLNKHSLLIQLDQRPVSPTYVAGADGARYRVQMLMLRMRSSFSYETVPVTHHTLGEAQATLGKLQDEQGRDVFDVLSVQVSGKPNQVRVQVDPAEPAKPAKPAKPSSGASRSKDKRR